MEKIDLNQYLANNAYPGRGIAIAKSPDGAKIFIGYWIMGRSENSRNRVFDIVEERGGIETRADKTGNKVVLVGNAKVNSSNAAKYSLKLANVTVHIGSKDNAAVATVGATAANYLATYTGNNVTGVQAQ